MLNRIFPERIDNHYRGYKLAIWLFVLIAFMKLAISLLHIFSADGGASISTIPIDMYTSGAAQNVIALFSRLGLEQFLFGALLVVVLFRYRAMIPLMYVLIVLQTIALRGVAYMKPLALAGTSGANTSALVLAILSISGLVLSLMGTGDKSQSPN